MNEPSSLLRHLRGASESRNLPSKTHHTSRWVAWLRYEELTDYLYNYLVQNNCEVLVNRVACFSRVLDPGNGEVFYSRRSGRERVKNRQLWESGLDSVQQDALKGCFVAVRAHCSCVELRSATQRLHCPSAIKQPSAYTHVCAYRHTCAHTHNSGLDLKAVKKTAGVKGVLKDILKSS